MADLRENTALGVFELDEGGATAFARVRIVDGDMWIDHVEVPTALRGAGTAGRLMQALVKEAQARHLRPVPVCSYAAAWLRRNTKG